jgi:hypothetical protein
MIDKSRTNWKIGDKVYPVDNSWVFNITTMSDSYVNLCGAYGESPKCVTVVSGPYTELVESMGRILTIEFRTVLWDGELYRVTNNFVDSASDPVFE